MPKVRVLRSSYDEDRGVRLGVAQRRQRTGIRALLHAAHVIDDSSKPTSRSLRVQSRGETGMITAAPQTTRSSVGVTRCRLQETAPVTKHNCQRVSKEAARGEAHEVEAVRIDHARKQAHHTLQHRVDVAYVVLGVDRLPKAATDPVLVAGGTCRVNEERAAGLSKAVGS